MADLVSFSHNAQRGGRIVSTTICSDFVRGREIIKTEPCSICKINQVPKYIESQACDKCIVNMGAQLLDLVEKRNEDYEGRNFGIEKICESCNQSYAETCNVGFFNCNTCTIDYIRGCLATLFSRMNGGKQLPDFKKQIKSWEEETK